MKSKRKHDPYVENELRLQALDKRIDYAFGALSPDDVDELAEKFEASETRMIEVNAVRPTGSIVADLYDDLEFNPVFFPEEILKMLKANDVFLATLGLMNGVWRVIYLSPAYRSSEWN